MPGQEGEPVGLEGQIGCFQPLRLDIREELLSNLPSFCLTIHATYYTTPPPTPRSEMTLGSQAD
jgi:hypothetical protein